ncbi:uncharacterized protein AB675_4936 [Cyphellophora attinorum]|uniref:Uncharacterized protein n=1 Tax=Cyphellophora attinorum TaxID=1664694 RepID=A0A0N1NV89_9EURO|nr:uncharacterized protein AB675_4936 [Phialophora attinorum]KPI34615.1 hypothetical protein AB675_4936 [Phialophora attinorum]
MATLDTIPAEIRLKIFEQYIRDWTCRIALTITPSCSNHSFTSSHRSHRYSDDRGHIRTRSQLLINSTPVVYDNLCTGLLGSNRKIRREFIACLGKDLQLDVFACSDVCDNCDNIDNVSDFVDEPRRGLVKTIGVEIRGGMVKLKPQRSISDGFPIIRKVSIPRHWQPIHLGDELIGACFRSVHDTRFYDPGIHVQQVSDTDVQRLREVSEAQALEMFSSWLRHLDATTTSGNGPECESSMTVGKVKHSFTGNGRDTWSGDYATILVKKAPSGSISFTFTPVDTLDKATRWFDRKLAKERDLVQSGRRSSYSPFMRRFQGQQPGNTAPQRTFIWF